METSAVYNSDSPADIKPTIRKRKKRTTMPPPTDQAPRRSGRKRQQTVTPFDLVDVDSERFQEALSSGRKRRKTTPPPTYQEEDTSDSDKRMSSTELLSPPPPRKQQPRRSSISAANDVEAAFDDLELQLQAEDHTHSAPHRKQGPLKPSNTLPEPTSLQSAFDDLEVQLLASAQKETHADRQAQKIEKLKQQLKEARTANNQTSTNPNTEGMLAKKDQELRRKDTEIKKLVKEVERVKSLHTISRLGLETRDKEIKMLREKHRALVRVAGEVAGMYGGMGVLRDALEGAGE